MEGIRLIVVSPKDIENPYGEYSGNLTSHMIKHPELIGEKAKFIAVELGIITWERLQTTSTGQRVDLVFEDEENIYLLEVKDDANEVEDGKKQVVEYAQIFLKWLNWRKAPLTKHVVPIVATISS